MGFDRLLVGDIVRPSKRITSIAPEVHGVISNVLPSSFINPYGVEWENGKLNAGFERADLILVLRFSPTLLRALLKLYSKGLVGKQHSPQGEIQCPKSKTRLL